MLVLLVAQFVPSLLTINCSETTLALMRTCTLAEYKLADRPQKCEYQECDCVLGDPFDFKGSMKCEVRRKGSSSWRPVDARPSLKIKFENDVAIKGHPGWDGDKFTLNAFVQGTGESEAYAIFRKYKVPAPETEMIDVCFSNPCVRQKYLLLESINKAFRKKHFDENALEYEVEGVIKADKDDSPEITFEEFKNPSNWNQTALRRYAAAEYEVNHWDGLCAWEFKDPSYIGNNAFIFVYNELFHPVPWGLDQTMQCDDGKVKPYERTVCPVVDPLPIKTQPPCRGVDHIFTRYNVGRISAWLPLTLI